MGRSTRKTTDLGRDVLVENVWVLVSDTDLVYSHDTGACITFNTKELANKYRREELPNGSPIKPRKARIVEGWG